MNSSLGIVSTPDCNGNYSFSGPWLTEEQAVNALLTATKNLFRPYLEVEGRYFALRPGVSDRGARADCILVPTNEMCARGWDLGIIGVEAKRPGEKAGRAISQVLDYSLAVFRLASGFDVVPRYWVLWHLEKVSGAVESVLCQNRIACGYYYHDGIRFSLGNRHILDTSRFASNLTAPMSSQALPGEKVGSR